MRRALFRLQLPPIVCDRCHVLLTRKHRCRRPLARWHV
jgi:hypothetical protein